MTLKTLLLSAILATGALSASAAPLPAEAPKPVVARSFVEPVTGLRFVRIPAGSFTMGSRFGDTEPEADRKWYADEAPPRTVTLSRDFWLASTETTVAAFRLFVAETGYVTTAERAGQSLGAYSLTTDAQGHQTGQWGPGKGLDWRHTGWKAGDDHPVVHVSWTDASAFVQWLRDKTGRPFRLPTEAEWEYAAGGSDHTLYSWGDREPSSGQEGNIADARFAAAYPQWKYPVLKSVDDGFVHTAPVGYYRANGFGLHDMTGNVWEWCADYYAADYYLKGSAQDPQGPSTGSQRVHRGGGFDWELPYLRVAKRRRTEEQTTAANIGFRLALQAE